ncbi:FAS1 domain-containing protein [Heracleum sosnowskyi]|uniref:FAS1 domain-containing protein n=1 Tax=Heracleum sosnowskyi TaxID=360622 RepID=A0AAD8J7Z1_9APIA|nr:FAS1 domain-containing protein [Heracleum sosnowskyi]
MPLLPPTLSLILLAIIISWTPANIHAAKSKDLLAAIEEMQRSTFYTYVVLINMAPDNLNIQGNVTFLMPNDRILANSTFLSNDVSQFLLSHAIPSSLFFEDLQHFPTGSMIPTLKPDTMLHVLNSGRRHFFLNNIQIVTPNICTSSTIKCHGIDGVITQVYQQHSNTPPFSCSNSTNAPTSTVAAPPPSQSTIAPTPTENAVTPSHSASYPRFSPGGLIHFLITCVLVPGLFFI